MNFKVKQVLKKLSLFFIEKGKVLSKEEYHKLGLEQQPVAGMTIRTELGSYPKMLKLLRIFAENNGYNLPEEAQAKKSASAKAIMEKISG